MGRQVFLRSQLYAVLAQSFREPEMSSGKYGGYSLIQLLQQSALTLDAEALGPAVGRLVEALEITQGPAEQALRALEVEYNRLFVGPGRPEAPPYESFYRDKWGLVMGRAAREVERRYAEAGLALAPGHGDLPDHVATELGFMAYLTNQEAEAEHEERRIWLERERSFLYDHLGAWLPLLCQRVREASQHLFYTALADLTETFVSLDMMRSGTRHEPRPEGAMGL